MYSDTSVGNTINGSTATFLLEGSSTPSSSASNSRSPGGSVGRIDRMVGRKGCVWVLLVPSLVVLVVVGVEQVVSVVVGGGEGAGVGGDETGMNSDMEMR